jgi:crotonobetainyl-CoA:carnitine CoA-transferase CaiB-like acyl-CoA transferase
MTRVIDMAGHPGVYAGRLLAESGHGVIRVEPPGGDEVRRLGPYVGQRADVEHGAFHQYFNAGKRSLSLDVTSQEGREVLLKLLSTADVAIMSEPLAVDELTLREANPRLVLVVVDDQGRPELTAYARAGLLSLTGQPGQAPSLMGGHVIYAATGLFVAQAASAAMLVQRIAGTGQTVKVDVQQAMEVFLDHAAAVYATSGGIVERLGSQGAVTATSGAIPAADGYWMLSVSPAPDRWAKLMDWVQDPVLKSDPSLAEEEGRAQRKEFIMERIQDWSKGLKKLEGVAEAQKRGITASPVSTTVDLAEDAHLIDRGFLREIEHPEFGRMLFPIGGTARSRDRTLSLAPRLGEHTAALLSELGYSEPEQHLLLERGVI